MIGKMVRAALAGTLLALSATAAFAEGKPISDTPVGLEHDPQGIIVRATTDRDGTVVFRALAPGDYVLVIDGPGLVASMDRILPSPPPKSSGGGLSIGIGGMFGGGGSQRSSPGGPAGGGSHGGSGSGGGVGVGVSVPVGGSGDEHDEIGFDPVWQDLNAIVSIGDGGVTFSSETPLCRDAASHGMRIGFSVPPNGGSTGNAVSAAITWDAPAGGWQRR